MTASAHADTFVLDRLPPPELRPELRFDLPELRYPAHVNCAHRLLDRHVERGEGDRRCIVSADTQWSYRDLYERASRIAHVLAGDLGVVPGDRVLLRGFNAPMLAACWFAVMKAGAVAVTAMPLYRAGELRTIVEKAQIRYAICDARLADDLAGATSGNSAFRTLHYGEGGELEAHMARAEPSFDNVATAAEDPALIAFTSGTTGAPKAAVHPHRAILATCDTYGRHVLRATRDDLFAGSPPLGFTFGLGGLLLFPLDAGAATLLLEKATPEPLAQAIEAYGVSAIFTAPQAYRAMTDLADRFDLSSLRRCVSAGETLALPIFERWKARTGLSIMDGIGSTEMLHIFVGSPLERAVAGATGEAVPGYTAQIHDDAGRALPPGEIGRLAVKGPTGCCYLDDERQSRYVQNGWNYPGDAYRMDERGYFHYVARTDDMIIAAGYNISGPEVEQALLGHADVAECAVVGKPDPARQTNIVKAYVVAVAGAPTGEDAAKALQTFVRERIATFKAPREIEFVRELPRTQTGKVQRFRLREQAAKE